MDSQNSQNGTASISKPAIANTYLAVGVVVTAEAGLWGTGVVWAVVGAVLPTWGLGCGCDSRQLACWWVARAGVVVARVLHVKAQESDR